MTNSLLDDVAAGGPVRGCQDPRIGVWPDYSVSAGPEVIELCESAGVYLDPWQQLIMTHGLGERDDEMWSAFEVGLVVARQNGKGDVLMARALGGLLVLDEELIIYTAHEFKTAIQGFNRCCSVIANSDVLRPKFKKPRTTTGQERLETTDGRQLQFLARSSSSGRGFTADCIIFDESQILTPAPIRATVPTLSSVPNPQLWYAGTAGNQQSIHLGSVRARAQEGGDGQLAYFEWSVDDDKFDPADPHEWAKANPAMGIRISLEYIGRERKTMAADPAGFAAERLGVGDWPADGSSWVIPEAKWAACDDGQVDDGGERTRPEGEVCFAVDVNPIRTVGAIAVAGERPDGLLAVEIVDQEPGVDWLLTRARQLERRWFPVGWVIDKTGPAGTLIPAFKEAGLVVLEPSGSEVGQAAEGFYDRAVTGRLRHVSDSRLTGAVAGAVQHPMQDAWRWGRRKSTSEISPLVAASLAVWGFEMQAGEGLSPDDITVF